LEGTLLDVYVKSQFRRHQRLKPDLSFALYGAAEAAPYKDSELFTKTPSCGLDFPVDTSLLIFVRRMPTIQTQSCPPGEQQLPYILYFYRGLAEVCDLNESETA
jgi:hypothetical protein